MSVEEFSLCVIVAIYHSEIGAGSPELLCPWVSVFERVESKRMTATFFTLLQGRVGINTDKPEEALSVNGNIRVTGCTGR